MRQPPLARDDMYARIYAVVREIPRGSVATYGQVAATIGYPRHARMAGRALRALPDRSDVPWHRVVNASGEISRRTVGDSHELQQMLLEAEGIEFDRNGRMELESYRWEPPDDGPAAQARR